MFVICGQPRSGTTLLAQCLSAHPDIVIPDESDWLIPAAFIVDRVPDEGTGRRLVADVLVSSERFAASVGAYLSPEAARAAVMDAPYELAAITAAVYAAVAASGGARVAGDKSPNDLKFARILLKTGFFDGAVPVIHLVRDVRDIMVSFRDLGWAQGLDNGLPRFWSAHNLLINQAVPRRGTPYTLVRYEDFVTQPEAALRSCCELIGVPFDPVMLDDEARYAQFAGHRDMGQHAATYRPISADKVGAHREVFDDASLERANRLGREGLEAFGYL